MLVLYDTAHNKLCGLDHYSELYVEEAVPDTSSSTPIVLPQLHFKYPQEDSRNSLIDYECYIGTENDGEFIVKDRNLQTTDDGITWVEYTCDLNVEPLKGTLIDNFAPGSVLAEDSANLALSGTGWVVGYSDITKRRTSAKVQCTVFEALEDIAKAYACEITFDTGRKQVIIHQKQGTDRGEYFAEQLNLKSLQVQGNSRSYVTRLYPIGKDGMTIASVNGGVEYVSNYQYSTKTNCNAYWIDNRYTNPADMLADAIERLDYMSKPTRAYSVSLSRLDNARIGDWITLLSESVGVREQQRIVKTDRYPDEPQKSTAQIANRIASLDDIALRVSDAADTVDAATDSTGAIQSSSVQVSNGDGTYSTLKVALENVGTLIAAKIDATEADIRYANLGDFTALQGTVTGKFTAYDGQFHTIETDFETVNGTITALDTRTTNLETDNATVHDTLTALNVTVEGKLSASDAELLYAKISDMDVANGNIDTLTTKLAAITVAVGDSWAVNKLAAGSITAGDGVIANGAIGDAQIANLSVAKLLAGTISTDKFTVQSDAGNLSISGNTLHVWDASGKERVSLGLNGSDYNLTVRAADGQTTIFGATGVTHAGITDGAVDDSKIAADAAINASKIDQESLITRINGANTYLQAGRIYYDPTAQTLDVAFSGLSTTVSGLSSTTSSQGTAISTMQGQISNKIWQTDITTAVSSVNMFSPAVGSVTGGSAAATQTKVNGNFANGATGWVCGHGTVSVANQIAAFTGDGSGTQINASASNALAKSIVSGQRIYVQIKFKVGSLTGLNYVNILWEQNVSPYTLVTSAQIPKTSVTGDWQYYGVILTAPATFTGADIVIQPTYDTADHENGSVIQIDGTYGFKCVDMGTNTSNPFYSMTADQMNKMVGPAGYWEGSKNIGGVTCMVRADGTVMFDGVAVAAFRVEVSPTLKIGVTANSTPLFTLVSGQPYTLSCKIVSGTSSTNYNDCNVEITDNAGIANPANFLISLQTTTHASSTMTAGTAYSSGWSTILNAGVLDFFISAGATFSAYTVRIQLEQNSAATAWKQSTYGIQPQINTLSSELTQTAGMLGLDLTSMSWTSGGKIDSLTASINAVPGQITAAVSSAATYTDTQVGTRARSFVSQPTPPYSVGDVWMQGTTGDIMRCTTARSSGSYTASDWTAASSVTESRIYSAEQKITPTAITQTVKENIAGNDIISIINQTATTASISASKINLTGYITATNLSTAGQTTINGANLQTGTITADKVNSEGLTIMAEGHTDDCYASITADGSNTVLSLFGDNSSGRHPKLLIAFSNTGALFSAENDTVSIPVRIRGGASATSGGGANFDSDGATLWSGTSNWPQICSINLDCNEGNINLTPGGPSGSLGSVKVNGKLYVAEIVLSTASGGAVYPNSKNVNQLSYASTSDHANYLEIVTGSYGSWGVNLWASDESLKCNITPTDYDSLSELRRFHTYSFDFKDGGRHVKCGLTSQDINRVDTAYTFGVPQPDNTVLYQPDISTLIPAIIRGEQQLADIADDHNLRIAMLESQINALQARVAELEAA